MFESQPVTDVVPARKPCGKRGVPIKLRPEAASISSEELVRLELATCEDTLSSAAPCVSNLEVDAGAQSGLRRFSFYQLDQQTSDAMDRNPKLYICQEAQEAKRRDHWIPRGPAHLKSCRVASAQQRHASQPRHALDNSLDTPASHEPRQPARRGVQLATRLSVQPRGVCFQRTQASPTPNQAAGARCLVEILAVGVRATLLGPAGEGRWEVAPEHCGAPVRLLLGASLRRVAPSKGEMSRTVVGSAVGFQGEPVE